MSNPIYRKIYIKNYGPIPKEPDGRSYEIHHIDGNHANNDPFNLKALTIQEHYDIHYKQGDYGACWLIAKHKLNLPFSEFSNLCRLKSLKQIKDGTHPFLDKKFREASMQKNEK